MTAAQPAIDLLAPPARDTPQCRVPVWTLIDEALGPSVLIDAAGRVVAHASAALPLLQDAGVRYALERLALGAQLSGHPAQQELVLPGTPNRRFQVRACPMLDPEGQALVWLQAQENTIQDHLIEALRESRALFRDLSEAAGEISFQLDAQGRFSYLRPPGALGYAAWELNGQLVTLLGGAAASLVRNERLGPIDLWLTAKDGAARCLSLVSVPVRNGGAFAGVRVVARDVTEDRQAAAALASFQQREAISLAVLAAGREETDPARMLERALAAVRTELGAAALTLARRSGAVTLGQRPRRAVVSSVDVRARNQSLGTLTLAFAPDRREADGVMLRLAADALALVLLQVDHLDDLSRLSLTDELTGLANRRAFEADVTRRLAALARTGGRGVLLLLDMDFFKQLNDRCGHAVGDAALKMLAGLMRESARAEDLAARLGGDEFAFWLDGADAAGAERIASVLQRGLVSRAVTLGDGSVPLSLSIGAAVAQPGLDDLAKLTMRADDALYAVKRAGRRGFKLWDGALAPQPEMSR